MIFPISSSRLYTITMLVALAILWPGKTPLSEDEVIQLTLPEYPPIETFDPISERPLFHSTRRPKPKTEEVQEEGVSQSELMEKWRLVGVILKNESPLALMSEKQGEKRLTLAKGMPLDQTWVISEIGEDFVVLEGNEEQARLELWQPRDSAPIKPERKKDNGAANAPQRQIQNTNTRTQRAQGTPVPAVAPGQSGTNGG